MNNISSYCGLTNSRMRASEKDLLVRENRKIDISDMLEAVTLRGAGEQFDMEKLETLGDSFLKYSMTLGEFILFPDFFFK